MIEIRFLVLYVNLCVCGREGRNERKEKEIGEEELRKMMTMKSKEEEKSKPITFQLYTHTHTHILGSEIAYPANGGEKLANLMLENRMFRETCQECSLKKIRKAFDYIDKPRMCFEDIDEKTRQIERHLCEKGS